MTLWLEGFKTRIFCTKCGQSVHALKVRSPNARGQWLNRCGACGELFAAPPPDNGGATARRLQRLERERERLGQLRLFPDKGSR